MESNITLRQGLETFRSTYKDNLSHDKVEASDEAKSFFLSHDIAHVLFGCDITLYGEGSVKIWTIFGTTLGFWNHIRGYQDANAFELSKDSEFIFSSLIVSKRKGSRIDGKSFESARDIF